MDTFTRVPRRKDDWVTLSWRYRCHYRFVTARPFDPQRDPATNRMRSFVTLEFANVIDL